MSQTSLDHLSGRVAVVTGAASGLGLAMCRRFTSEGMRVVMADVEDGPLHAAVAELTSRGYDVHGVVTDVSSAADLDHLADAAYEAYGSVHVLCNNAGVVKSGRAWALSLDDWEWVLGVDLWSVIHGIRAFIPRMLAGGEPGHVVNTSSIAGLLPMPNLTAYGAAKAGVVAISEDLQLDLAGENADIAVSVLVPGFIPTRILESERTRPAHLVHAGANPSTPRTTTGVTPTMDADEVAGLVAEAIRERSFWVLTHPKYQEIIRQRATGIGTPQPPVAAPVW